MVRKSRKFLRWLGHQDWIRYGIRNMILRKFSGYDSIDSCEFTADFFGLNYSGNLNNLIDWEIYFFGAYEKQLLFLLKDLVRDIEDPVFIDVGSNVGQHSLYMSQYCDHVYSFEPLHSLCSILKEKIRRNNIRNISVHCLGLASEEKWLDFFAPKGSNWGTGSFLSSFEPSNEFIGKLKVVRGDDFLEGIGVRKVDLIKIDVEGFEREVLRGLSNILENNRPAVLMEFSKRTRLEFKSLTDLVSILPEGYIVYRVITNKPRCLFFNQAIYEYTSFDFDRTEGNILLMPSEINLELETRGKTYSFLKPVIPEIYVEAVLINAHRYLLQCISDMPIMQGNRNLSH